MYLTAWVTLAAVAIYFWIGANVSRVRARLAIPAPLMEGPVEFQSCLRVQMNTLEQLPLFLPPLWMCAVFLGDRWAAAGGALWCVGRVLYAVGYYSDPQKRILGFFTSLAASALLVAGAAAGLVIS